MIDEATQPTDCTAGRYIVFADASRVCAGVLPDVAVAARRALDRAPDAVVLIFDRRSAEIVDVDLRGTEADVRGRLAPVTPGPIGRGRPKLGVVAREVTLLPRHWEWLAAQPGGASVALRKLVEVARKADANSVRERNAAAYRFMTTIAGDLPGFEEATRALFALDRARLESCISDWPLDIQNEILALANGAWAA